MDSSGLMNLVVKAIPFITTIELTNFKGQKYNTKQIYIYQTILDQIFRPNIGV